MGFSIVAIEAEANAKLLYRLLRESEADDLGSVCGFFEVNSKWRCPCCHRSKPEIARLDKNRNLMCALHWHHDHFYDLAVDKLPRERGIHSEDVLSYNSLYDSFARFPETLVCSDCNVAEGSAAKTIVGAPKHFSFAPFEIATFVVVRAGLPHIVDPDRAKAAYEAAVPSMKLMGSRLRAVSDPKKHDGTFEPIGAPAWRVLNEIRAKMKMKDAG